MSCEIGDALSALDHPSLRVVATLSPNWHGDMQWLVEDPSSDTRYCVRAIAVGREMRWEDARGHSIDTVKAQLGVADAFVRAGVPFMARTGGPLMLGEHVVVMFRWLDGAAAESSTYERARSIGRLLRRLHEVNAPVSDALPVHDLITMAERSVATLASVRDMSFARRVIDAARFDERRIAVHGDVNFPNVLWSDGRVSGIVDFDQIGASRPIEELAWVVKWWSRACGIGDHNPDADLARAVVDGYGGVDDVRLLSNLLWITGCLNASSVMHVIKEGPAAFDALGSRADRLAGML